MSVDDWPRDVRVQYDNDRRAARAKAAVLLHEGGQWGSRPPGPESIYDLVSDLHHLADQWGMQWEELLDMAAYHYECEVRGDEFSRMER